jgi:peptidoglycan/LPS O-acetylase OafA/YrhL
MGYIRFLLAVIVIMAHANAAVVPTIDALGAVQVFFVISGFYMAATYERNYTGKNRAIRFWASRYMRLYPTYLILLLLTWLASSAFGGGSNMLRIYDYFISTGPKPDSAVWTLFFQDVISVDEATHNLLPVRQAWSISAELAFYALVPLLIVLRRYALYIALALFAVKAVLFYQASWRYAYFPFYSEIGYFVLGLWLFYQRSFLTWNRPAAIALAVAFSAYVLLAGPSGWENSTTLRSALLVFVTMLMLPSCFEHLNGRASAFLGDLSYGIYIAHFLVIEVLIDVGAINLENSGILGNLGRLVAVAGFSTATTFLIEILVQRRVDRWRRRLTRARATPISCRSI